MTSDLLKDGAKVLGLSITDEVLDKLLAFGRLLLKWNKTYNLTAIDSEDDVVIRHILDSLSIVATYQKTFGNTAKVLDVGSGGGLPGIPLAIYFPNYEITLCDSVKKKAAFLRQVAVELNLTNVHIFAARVEEMPDAVFDAISSRAFASLEDFVNLTKKFAVDKTQWMAMKGKFPKDEIERLPKNFLVKQVIQLSVPFLNEERHLVILAKKSLKTSKISQHEY